MKTSSGHDCDKGSVICFLPIVSRNDKQRITQSPYTALESML